MSAQAGLGYFSEPSYISIGDPYASTEGERRRPANRRAVDNRAAWGRCPFAVSGAAETQPFPLPPARARLTHPALLPPAPSR